MINYIAVPSKSQPNETHIVNRDNRGLTCDCSGFQYRKYCSHVKHAAPLFALAVSANVTAQDASKILSAQSIRLQSLADKVAELSLDKVQADRLWAHVDALETALSSAISSTGKAVA